MAILNSLIPPSLTSTSSSVWLLNRTGIFSLGVDSAIEAARGSRSFSSEETAIRYLPIARPLSRESENRPFLISSPETDGRGDDRACRGIEQDGAAGQRPAVDQHEPGDRQARRFASAPGAARSAQEA